MGFTGVYNWLSSARVEDKKAKTELIKAQHDFERILNEATEQNSADPFFIHFPSLM